MDLGSGKITKKEMLKVPHHLLDVISPNTRFSVQKYKQLGDIAIEKILAKNKLPINGHCFYQAYLAPDSSIM